MTPMPPGRSAPGPTGASAQTPASPRARPLAWLLPAAVLTLLVAAGVGLLASAAPASRPDSLASEFVRLSLAFAQLAPDEVDSYFGPASLRPAASAPRIPLDALSRRAHELVALLDAEIAADREIAPPSEAAATASTGQATTLSPAARSTRQRFARLRGEAHALANVIESASPASPHASFDEEARRVYGMTFGESASPDDRRIDVTLAALDRLLPRPPHAAANEDLATRFDVYRQQFVVPADRRRAVFAAALDACRTRTAAHWTLPAGEHLDLKWDIAAPAAWHRYDGHGRSILTINPAALTFVDAAVDLACHEGYPGHHTQFLLGERPDGPIEDTLALLRSPLAMMREAAANYGVDLAFPAAERLRFERDTLFPLAGLDPATAADYFRARQLVRALEPAIAPILRDYRDRRVSAADAADRLRRRALVTTPPALLQFVDQLGPYVLGYTAARDRVAAYVARTAPRGDAWKALEIMLTLPEPARVLNSVSSPSSPSPAT